MVLPGTGKAFEQFQMDDASCREGAPAVHRPGDAATSSGATSAVVGTVLGGAGAAICAAAGPGSGAAAGAGRPLRWTRWRQRGLRVRGEAVSTTPPISSACTRGNQFRCRSCGRGARPAHATSATVYRPSTAAYASPPPLAHATTTAPPSPTAPPPPPAYRRRLLHRRLRAIPVCRQPCSLAGMANVEYLDVGTGWTRAERCARYD
jgi:hypothetical protein